MKRIKYDGKRHANPLDMDLWISEAESLDIALLFCASTDV